MSESDSWRQIVNRAWNEPDFKSDLLTNTNEILRTYNIKVKEGVHFTVVQDQTKGVRYLVLPPKPNENHPELSIDDFGRLAESGDPGF